MYSPLEKCQYSAQLSEHWNLSTLRPLFLSEPMDNPHVFPQQKQPADMYLLSPAHFLKLFSTRLLLISLIPCAVNSSYLPPFPKQSTQWAVALMGAGWWRKSCLEFFNRTHQVWSKGETESILHIHYLFSNESLVFFECLAGNVIQNIHMY